MSQGAWLQSSHRGNSTCTGPDAGAPHLLRTGPDACLPSAACHLLPMSFPGPGAFWARRALEVGGSGSGASHPVQDGLLCPVIRALSTGWSFTIETALDM